MLDGLKPYSEYKDSGQPWLGSVPAHWHIERLDRLFSLRSESPVEGDQRVTGYLDGRVTLRSNVAGQKIKGVVKEAGWQRVHPGDFAISGMNAHLGGMGVSDSLGKCSPIYLVLIPKTDTNAAFVSRAVRHIAHSDALKVLVSTIRFNSADFKRDHLKLIWVQVPPPAEQAGIVRFLGAVDRKVNRFIRAKRRLIEVLTEQKQAIITHAVTKGLNPHAPLKPSGIDWEIPAHWEVSRVKTEMRCLNTRRIPLSGTERGKMTLRLYDYYGASGVIDKVDEYLFDDDLLLIAEDGANLVLRNLPLAIIARGKFWVNNHAHILKPKRGCLEYFAAVLEAIDYTPWITGAAQPKLTQDRLMAVRIPAPPVQEQHAIMAAVADQTRGLAEAIDRIKREIDLIREYRTRLVADVVTGKVDVRAAAASIPDEPSDVAAGDQPGEVLDGEDDDAEAGDADAEDAAPPREEVEA